MNIQTWENLILKNKSFFGLLEENVLETKIVDGLYHLFYLDDRREKQIMYIEEEIFEDFYCFSNDNEWNNIVVTKYLSPITKKPAFLVKATWKNYIVQYHFFIEKNITLYGYITYENRLFINFSEMPHEFNLKLRSFYRYLTIYINNNYSNHLTLEGELLSFLKKTYEQQSILAKNEMSLIDIKKRIENQYIQFLHAKREEDHEYAIKKVIQYNQELLEHDTYAVILWMTLVEVNAEKTYEDEQTKEQVEKWLKRGYELAKSKLTRYQRYQFRTQGIDLL